MRATERGHAEPHAKRHLPHGRRLTARPMHPSDILARHEKRDEAQFDQRTRRHGEGAVGALVVSAQSDPGQRAVCRSAFAPLERACSRVSLPDVELSALPSPAGPRAPPPPLPSAAVRNASAIDDSSASASSRSFVNFGRSSSPRASLSILYGSRRYMAESSCCTLEATGEILQRLSTCAASRVEKSVDVGLGCHTAKLAREQRQRLAKHSLRHEAGAMVVGFVEPVNEAYSMLGEGEAKLRQCGAKHSDGT